MSNTLSIRIWAHGTDKKEVVSVTEHMTVGEACGNVSPRGLLLPPNLQTYLEHAHKPCFLRTVSMEAVLKDSIHKFTTEKGGDSSMHLFTLHVIYPETIQSRL
jgi:hypothetical protein